jgi:hypothetical protein
MGERPATEARMQAVKHPQSIATKVCRRDAWAYRALLLELATPGADGAPTLVSARVQRGFPRLGDDRW